MRRVLALLMLLGLLATACSGGDDEAASSAGAEPAGVNGAAADAPAPQEAGAEEAGAEDAGADQRGADESDGAESTTVTGDLGSALPAENSSLDRIIKDGTMRVEVPDGEFDVAFSRVVDIAQRLGGGVAASQTSVNGDGHSSGSLTVRVPVESYEQLLVDVAEIGDVRHRSVRSEDVSAEFVDLEARRRQLQAQEDFYLGLLEDAADVQAAITIRGELDRIQTEIERITGRLNVLADRTSFSTLTVELFESGAPVPDTTPQQGLARYWQTGLDALVAAIGTMLVVGLGVLPLAVLIVIVLLLVRAIRRRPGSTVPAESPSGQ